MHALVRCRIADHHTIGLRVIHPVRQQMCRHTGIIRLRDSSRRTALSLKHDVQQNMRRSLWRVA